MPFSLFELEGDEDASPHPPPVSSCPGCPGGMFPAPDVALKRDGRGWVPGPGVVPAVEGAVGRGSAAPLTLKYSFWPEVVWQKKVEGKEWSYPV